MVERTKMKRRVAKGLGFSLAIVGVLSVAAVAMASERHAALAYSEARHRYGWAVDQPSEEEAVRKAVSDCGPGCTMRLAWHNGCGAYAEGQHNVHYGWALGRNREAAESAAISECSGRGGSNCTVRVWACN
jgi:hypothetical protein